MTAPKRQAPIEVTLPAHGVYLLESHHAPSFRMVEQSHAFLELFFVHSGSGAFRIGGQEHPCQRNDLVVVPPRQTHSIADNPDHPLTLYAVCVAAAVVRHEPGLFERLPLGRVRIGKAFAPRNAGHVSPAAVRADPAAAVRDDANRWSHARIAGLTGAGHGRRTAAGDKRDSGRCADGRAAGRRRAVCGRAAHRFFERTSLDDAASELGMSRRRFTTLFADVTGRTWADYLAELRVEYAQTLLRDTQRSIVSIAFECGYEELSSFYRAFKRATGQSPGDWRAAQRA